MIISLKDIEKKCGKLDKYEDWSEKNSIKKFESWLWCASQYSYMEKAKEILGRDYDLWIAEKALIDDEHSQKLINWRKEYEEKNERLLHKHFKTGVPGHLSEYIWLGKVNFVYSQINKILNPKQMDKEEEKIIKITIHKLDFSKPSNFNLNI